jgi:integrase
VPTETFTAAWVDRVKPPDTDRIEYWDAKQDGLGLRISHTGKKTWCVRYRSNGKRWRVILGDYPAIPLGEARLRAQEMLLSAARDNDPAMARAARRQAHTIEWLAGEYIEKYAKPRKRSWEKDDGILNQHVIPAWGGRKVHDVHRADVVALLDDIKAKTPIRANRTLACIRKMFNWAIERELIETSPCDRVKAPSMERPRDRWLSGDEIKAVWLALDAIGSVTANAIKMRLVTAQRSGEVDSMAWTDIDMESRVWTIPADVAKNARAHRVPLSELAMELLQAQRVGNKTRWVFPSRMKQATGMHIDNVHATVLKVKQTTGVDFAPHDLRRTAASHMAGLRVSRDVISKILNHAETTVTGRHYDQHDQDDAKREALSLWAERLMGIVD